MNRLLLSGLQLFNEAVQGKKIVYLYRVRSEQAKNDATALAFSQKTAGRNQKMQIQQQPKMELSVHLERQKWRSQPPVSLQRVMRWWTSWNRHWITIPFWRSGK